MNPYWRCARDARHTLPDAALAAASGKQDAASQTAFGAVIVIVETMLCAGRRADRQTATTLRVRCPGMNGNYDDENPGKGDRSPAKTQERKASFQTSKSA